MTHMDIVRKLDELYPGAHWTLRGTDYSGLEWLDDPSTKPTAKELGL